MKMADTTQDDKTDKQNYRPVSNLPSISKIFERIIYEDISPICVAVVRDTPLSTV